MLEILEERLDGIRTEQEAEAAFNQLFRTGELRALDDWHEFARHNASMRREIFGNPFRPVAIAPAWLAWNDGTVPKLAQTIYDDRRFDLLPILADALEEAGCDHADILTHCRGPGPHVRGCWVVDLLLGKE
jgi:hypothetical protein